MLRWDAAQMLLNAEPKISLAKNIDEQICIYYVHFHSSREVPMRTLHWVCSREFLQGGLGGCCQRRRSVETCKRVTRMQNHTEKKEINEKSTLAPIWFPHWPACKCTISRILGSWTRRFVEWEMGERSGGDSQTGCEEDGSCGRLSGICCTASETVYWAESVVQLYVIAMATEERRREGGSKARGNGG